LISGQPILLVWGAEAPLSIYQEDGLIDLTYRGAYQSVISIA
jgi:hypothetical protein